MTGEAQAQAEPAIADWGNGRRYEAYRHPAVRD